MKRDVGGSHEPVPLDHIRYVAAPYEIVRQFSHIPRCHQNPKCPHLLLSLGQSPPIQTGDMRFIECRRCIGGPMDSSMKESDETR